MDEWRLIFNQTIWAGFSVRGYCVDDESLKTDPFQKCLWEPHKGKLLVAWISPQPPPLSRPQAIERKCWEFVCQPTGHHLQNSREFVSSPFVSGHIWCSLRGSRICSKILFKSSLCIQSCGKVSVSQGRPPSACALAKLPSLVASPCRKKKYNSVRAWTWSAVCSSASWAHHRDFNGNKSVNESCSCSSCSNTTYCGQRLHLGMSFSHLWLRSWFQSLMTTCPGASYFPSLCLFSKVEIIILCRRLLEEFRC